MMPGDVVTADFPGVTGIKRRPAVVVSSNEYHHVRPDVILAVLTSNVSSATEATDHVLSDWQAAGLHRPSAFRALLFTLPMGAVRPVGRLSDRDWLDVQSRLQIAIAFK